jgi:tetratricopeptide (TPR) repeat protein
MILAEATAIQLAAGPVDPSMVNLYVIAAERLARHFGDTTRLHEALRLVDTVVTSPGDVSRAMLATNAVGVCRRLATATPDRLDEYLLRALDFAAEVADSANSYSSLAEEDGRAFRALAWQAARSRVTLNIDLSRSAGGRREQFLTAARYEHSRLVEFADASGDLDLRNECEELELELTRAAATSEAQGDDARPVAGPSAGSVADAVEQSCRAAVDTARRIKSLPVTARTQAVHEYLTLDYAELATNLTPLASELGISLHISRFLLALGAAASGRLAPLTLAAVRPFIMQVPDVGDVSGHQRNRLIAQNMPSRRKFDHEARCMAVICGIAAFIDAIADDSIFSAVASTMRTSNAALADRIGQMAKPQRLDSPALTRAEDLAAVQDLVRAFGQPRTSASRSESERAADAAATAQLALDSAQAELPILDVTEEPRAADAPGPSGGTPEDRLGRRIRIDGAPYVYERIIGTGRDHIVFELRNENTDERLAVKTRREDYSPLRMLAKYLDNVGPGQAFDTNEILRLTQLVLDLDPTNNVAAVNRGIALTLTGAFDEAHRWFEVALSAEPNDVIALFYDAYGLARRGRHQEAVDQISHAAECDARGLAGFARTLRRETETIRRSVEAVELNGTITADQMKALKELFA